MKLETILFLSFWSILLASIFIYVYFLRFYTFSDVCNTWTEYQRVCGGETVLYQKRYCEKTCSNCTTQESCSVSCGNWETYDSYDCNNNNYWTCKDSKTKWYVDYTCSSGSCVIEEYKYETYCGDSTETDGGDNPYVYGSVTINKCSNGGCTSYTKYDTCSGICSRSQLTEYYITSSQDTSESSKVYSDLFSLSKYCKNGAIYNDVSNPSISFSPSSRGWSSSDVSVTLSCGDDDESGCWTYSYSISNAV